MFGVFEDVMDEWTDTDDTHPDPMRQLFDLLDARGLLVSEPVWQETRKITHPNRPR